MTLKPTRITVLSRVSTPGLNAAPELISEFGIVYAHEIIYLSNDEGRYLWKSADGSGYSSSVLIKAEGVDWIRGHYASNSPQVAALRTAHALHESHAP